MKKQALYFLLSAVLVIMISCSTTQQFVFREPEPGKSLLVGAVLVENDGINDLYESKTSNITVVIVHKFTDEGKQQSKGYRIKTDKDGYFMIPNVSPGSFVLKGIEVDLGFANRYIISSMWEGNRQIYFDDGKIIDYNVRIWPPEATEKIIDMGINYFKIDRAGRILFQDFEALNNSILGLKIKSYTMPCPVDYFKEKYPELK
ncbi:MAG: hypothetical protein JSW07_02485 [bacterium]|nr:MAG: hypothetical protein JSW07_02485 [bacterium]